MAPSIAVVVPTFNRCDVIGLALESCFAQTSPAREVIVVDDGSTDSTRTALAVYGSRISVLHQGNLGAAAARNAGVQAATSEWIAFLDSDDEMEPTRLAVFEEALARWPSIIAHCGNATFYREGEPLHDHLSLHGRRAGTATHLVPRPLALHMEMQFLTPTFTVRRSALLDEAGFSSHIRIFEDYHLMTRIALRGPWSWSEQSLARIFRRGPASSNLFLDLPNKALEMGLSMVETHAMLLARSELEAGERRLVRQRLASSLADVADAHRMEGRLGRSVAYYARSIKSLATARTVARALLGMALGPLVRDRLRRRAPRADAGVPQP